MSIIVRKFLALFCICATFINPAAERAWSEDYVLYLTERGGSDAFDGRSKLTPIRTIRRAHEILLQDEPDGDVQIRVLPGNYYCRGMRGEEWTFLNSGQITITADKAVGSPAIDNETDPNRPVFWGIDEIGNPCPYSSVWMEVEHGRNEMNLTVKGLTITRYRGGITVRMNREINTRINQNVIIENVVFRRIGKEYHNPFGNATGVGALLFYYTHGNTVKNSYFRLIRNEDDRPGAIHGIYFTHSSHRNTIDNNVFWSISGSALKVSDYSNSNQFTNNRFISAPLVYWDRFCGANSSDTLEVCLRDSEWDCPSWNNYFPTTGTDKNIWSSISHPNGYSSLVQRRSDLRPCWASDPSSNVRLDLGGGTKLYGAELNHEIP